METKTKISRPWLLLSVLLIMALMIGWGMFREKIEIPEELKTSVVLDRNKALQIAGPEKVRENTVVWYDFTSNLPASNQDREISLESNNGAKIEELELNPDLSCELKSGTSFPQEEIKVVIPKHTPGKCAGAIKVKIGNRAHNTSRLISISVIGEAKLLKIEVEPFVQITYDTHSDNKHTVRFNDQNVKIVDFELEIKETTIPSASIIAGCKRASTVPANVSYELEIQAHYLYNSMGVPFGGPIAKSSIQSETNIEKQKFQINDNGSGERIVQFKCSPKDATSLSSFFVGTYSFRFLKTAQCGNEITEPGEQCDSGSYGDGACTATCVRKEIEPPPYCGNGIKDAGEACDDGNKKNNDPCTNACTMGTADQNRPLFVTSTVRNGEFGGIAGADKICQDSAEKATLEGTWKALLSSPSQTIETALYALPSKKFARLDGTVVANNPEDLFDESLEHPINITENLNLVSQYHNRPVWTGSTEGGTATDRFCQKQASDSISSWGTIGNPSAKDKKWISNGTRICSETAAFYCYQESISDPPPIPVETAVSAGLASGAHTPFPISEDLKKKGVQGLKLKVKNNVAGDKAKLTLKSYQKLRPGLSAPSSISNFQVVKAFEITAPSELKTELESALMEIQTTVAELRKSGIRASTKEDIKNKVVLGHFSDGVWTALPVQSISPDKASFSKDEPMTLTFSIRNFSDFVLTGNFAVCGNGAQEFGEACDDGNTQNGDRCSASCTIEPFCGDQILQTDRGEQCDDGTGNSDTGACTLSCQNAKCGDGKIRQGIEVCDDGNDNGKLDKCTAQCQAPACGDNLKNRTDEQCDGADGINANLLGQSCEPKTSSNACKIKNAVQLKSSSSIPVAYTQQRFLLSQVLDFTKMSPVKSLNFTGPSGVVVEDKTGAVNDGYNREGSKSYVVPAKAETYPFRVDLTYMNNSLPAFADFTITAPAPVCSNNVQETGEPCDDGNKVNTDACLYINDNTCRPAVCGDSFIHAGVEECEGKSTLNTNQDCGAVGTSSACKIMNFVPLKEDPVLQAFQIIPHRPFAFLPVINVANIEGLTYLNFESTDNPKATIADAELNYSQGATKNTDPGIRATFTPTRGGKFTFIATARFKTGVGASKLFELNVLPAYCGNAVIESGEECEDGNGLSNDSCIACKNAFCGDGFTRNGLGQNNPEQCDDKDTINDDECSNACTAPRCGDTIKQSGEECDGEEDLPGKNTCSAQCQIVGKLVFKDLSGLKVYKDQPFTLRDVIDLSKTASFTNLEFKDSRFDAWLANRVGPPPFSGNGIHATFYPNATGPLTFTVTAFFTTGPAVSKSFPFTVIEAVCGNQQKEPGEECDDGNNNGADKICSTSCKLQGTIELKLETTPRDEEDFSFTIDGGLNPGAFTLDTDVTSQPADKMKWSSVRSGTYTIKLPASPPAFFTNFSDHNLTTINESKVNNSTVENASTMKLQLDPGETIIVTYKPTKRPDCSDTRDNDGDEIIDFPNDTGCENANDWDEKNTIVGQPAKLIVELDTLPNDPQEFGVFITPFNDRMVLKDTGGIEAKKIIDTAIANHRIKLPNMPSGFSLKTIVCSETKTNNSIIQTGSQATPNVIVIDTILEASETVHCIITVTKNNTCGNTITDQGEQCDDGNSVNTDVCLNTCKNASCRDGFIQTGHEECDDGNDNNTDACTNACTIPRCGDNIKQGAEQCDDGNTADTDACTNECKNAICGDGKIRQGVETCDLGTAKNGQFGETCLVLCQELPFKIPKLDEEWNP